jgi:parallel beta-helix repeat protein
MKKYLVMIELLLLIGTNIVPRASPFTAPHVHFNQTWYVDDNNTQGPWNGSLEYPFQHISDAIQNATDYDIIYVFSGIYYEHISVNKPLQIIGEQKLTTIIDAEWDGTVVDIRSSETSIRGFTITRGGCVGVGGGVYVSETYKFNVISDNIIFNNNNCGLFIYRSTYTSILNNTIADNVYDVFIGGGNTHHIISGNTLRNDSIELDRTSYNTIQSNSFYNGGIFQRTSGEVNIIEGNFFDHGSIILTTPMRYTIVNNTFVHSRGIRINGNSPENWRYHIIHGNTIDGRSLFYSSEQHNIIVPSNAAEVIIAYCNNARIENLTITGTYGIDLNTCRYAIVSNNTLIDSDDIRLDICAYCTVCNNHLTNSFLRVQSAFSKFYENDINGAGIECIDSTGNTFANNRISNFTANGIFVQWGTLNTFLSNTVDTTNIAVYLLTAWSNRFLLNNFKNSSERHAFFDEDWYYLCHNFWFGNYWEGGWRIGPHLIRGRFNTHKWVTTGDHGDGYYIYLPFFNFDWLPARKPHNIGV